MPRADLPTLIARGLSLIASLAALSVIVGWHAASPAMVTLGLGSVPMHYNTAWALLLCAGSCLSLSGGRRNLARALAAPVLLMACAHLIQFLTKARLGIDYWFHRLLADSEFINTLNLAPTVAVALLLLSATLVLVPSRSSPSKAEFGHGDDLKLVRAAGLSCFTIALVGVWAIVDQSNDIYGWGNLARMAPISLLALILLGLASIAISLRDSAAHPASFDQKLLVRLLIPSVIALSVVLWAELEKGEARHIGESIRLETAMTSSGLNHSLSSQAYSLRRMAARLTQVDEIDRGLWRQDAEQYLRDHPGMIALALIDKDPAAANWVTVDAAPEALLSKRFHTTRQEASKAENKLAISAPDALGNGSSQFILVSPVSHSEPSQNAIVAVFDGAALLKGVISDEYMRHFNIEVSLDDQPLFESTPMRDLYHRYWAVEQRMTLLGKAWRLRVWPTPTYYSDIRTNLQDLVLVAGLIIAALLMYSAQLLDRSTLATRRLAESQRRLSLLLENAGEGIYGLDMNGRTTFLNRAAERITGFSADEMLNKQQHSIIHHSHADGTPYPLDACKIYRVLKQGGTHFERDEVFWRKDGSCYPVEYTCAAITNGRGTPEGAVVVFRDISSLKEIENKLRATNEELEQFAYLASHDLKAPLRVISNVAQWLGEDLAEHLEDEDRENMDLLQSRVQRMERLLDDLLQYSRIGRVTDDRFHDKVNGADMLDNILSLLSPPETVHIRVSENFATVETARMPLQQMLYNLIGNAIKHHDKESIHIDVEVKEVRDDYVFSVSDDGPGIEPKYHQRIFEIFHTLKPRDQIEGSGIGLSVVKKYADIYNGRIELCSNPGQGTCFTLTWPKVEVPTLWTTT